MFSPLQSWTGLEGKRILSTYPYIAVWSSRPELVDPYTAHYLEKKGKWTPLAVLDDVRRRRYDVVVAPTAGARPHRSLATISPTIWSAVVEHYEPFCPYEDISILAPRGRPPAGELAAALASAGCGRS